MKRSKAKLPRRRKAPAKKTNRPEESAVERLLDLMRQPGVARPRALHEPNCPFGYEGKEQGPCTCGAQTLDAKVRQALVRCYVPILESPQELKERIAL